MLPLYKSLITDQFNAALAMLNECVEKCPDELWYEPVVEWKFCQVAFHALFYADVYLGTTLEELKQQPFHREHANTFADYEDLKPERPQASYEKGFVRSYLEYCRNKAKTVLAAETDESLAHRPGFDWLDIPRAEVHVYNIRHLHHHAAQLSLHLRRKTGEGAAWQSSGWAEKSEPRSS